MADHLDYDHLGFGGFQAELAVDIGMVDAPSALGYHDVDIAHLEKYGLVKISDPWKTPPACSKWSGSEVSGLKLWVSWMNWAIAILMFHRP